MTLKLKTTAIPKNFNLLQKQHQKFDLHDIPVKKIDYNTLSYSASKTNNFIIKPSCQISAVIHHAEFSEN